MGYSKYDWSPGIYLDDSLKANPTAKVDKTTVFKVRISDPNIADCYVDRIVLVFIPEELIPEADLVRIFDPFWQGPGDKRGGYRGIGLGLVIAKQVVEGHGGTITVADGPTGGTRVSMVLPQ